MKRLILGLIVLAALLALGITVSAVFTLAHEPTAELLEDAKEAALDGDWDRAIVLFNKAQNRWKNAWRFTAAFADHSPMDEMDGLFAQLEVFARQKSREQFPALCARLAELAEAMAESHRFCWWMLL